MSWDAPFHPEAISGQVHIPGSKSLTNRFLVMAALGDQPSVIRKPLVARDTLLMIKALEAMGTGVEFYDNELFIYPAPLHGADVQVGLAGTVMRFLPAVAMLAHGPVHFDGDAAARVRPMGPVVDAIGQLGVQVEYAVDDMARPVLPLTVFGQGRVAGGRIVIDASESSQFISALLLAAPRMDNGVEIRHVGGPIPSTPHLEMTVQVLRNAGIEVFTFPKDAGPVRQGHPAVRWLVLPGIPDVGNVEVEPDLSNAGPFLAAAMVTGGEVSIPGWPRVTHQPGVHLRDLFSAMGAQSSLQHNRLTLRGPDTVQPLDTDMHDFGELVPTVAAVAAYAAGPSVLRNIGQLRHHETDRLAAISTELNGLGGRAQVNGDDLVIEPCTLHSGLVHAYADHRMATFGAILGLRTPGIVVDDIATTAKTLPQFPQMWAELTSGIENVIPEDPFDDLREWQAA